MLDFSAFDGVWVFPPCISPHMHPDIHPDILSNVLPNNHRVSYLVENCGAARHGDGAEPCWCGEFHTRLLQCWQLGGVLSRLLGDLPRDCIFSSSSMAFTRAAESRTKCPAACTDDKAVSSRQNGGRLHVTTQAATHLSPITTRHRPLHDGNVDGCWTLSRRYSQSSVGCAVVFQRPTTAHHSSRLRCSGRRLPGLAGSPGIDYA